MERFKVKKQEKLIRTLKNVNKKGQTKLRQKEQLKKKIIIYSDDDKYFVNHFTAYALGLINTRAVMLEKTKLVAISLDTLKKLQADANLEIEYKLLKDEPLINSSMLSNLDFGFYGIGIHGIFSGNKINKAESILNNGLEINNNAKSILCTTVSLGLNNQDLDESILYKYQYGTGEKVNIIIAVPTFIENEKHEKIYLGFPEQNFTVSANQYNESCLLDRICSKLRHLPREFILGYINESSFVANDNFYDNLTKESKETLFNTLKNSMDNLSLIINKMIDEKNFEALEKMQHEFEKLNIKPTLILNALEIIRKNKSKKRHIIVSNEEQINSYLARSHRKILLNSMLTELEELKEQQIKK